MTNGRLATMLRASASGEGCVRAILVTRAGSAVAAAGRESKPSLASVGPIVAALFGTGREMGRMIGAGEQRFQLQRGGRYDLLLFPMPAGMVLAATFVAGIDEELAVTAALRLEEDLVPLLPMSQSTMPGMGISAELREEAEELVERVFPAVA